LGNPFNLGGSSYKMWTMMPFQDDDNEHVLSASVYVINK
jgi:hypothetical protein